MSNGGTIAKHMGTARATSEPRQGFPEQGEALVRQELLPHCGTQVLLSWAVLSQSSVCAFPELCLCCLPL